MARVARVSRLLQTDDYVPLAACPPVQVLRVCYRRQRAAGVSRSTGLCPLSISASFGYILLYLKQGARAVYRIVVATIASRQAYFLRMFSERGDRWAFGSDEASVADEVLRSSTDLLLVDAVALGEPWVEIVASVRRMNGLADLPVLAVIDEDNIRRFSRHVLGRFCPRPHAAGRDGAANQPSARAKARRRARPGKRRPVTIDYDKYEVTRSGRRMSLTYREHELLRFLGSNPNKAFTREAILDRVWGSDYIGGVRTVDVHIRRLRAKIGDHRGKTIETVRGVGYRFRKSE